MAMERQCVDSLVRAGSDQRKLVAQVGRVLYPPYDGAFHATERDAVADADRQEVGNLAGQGHLAGLAGKLARAQGQKWPAEDPARILCPHVERLDRAGPCDRAVAD